MTNFWRSSYETASVRDGNLAFFSEYFFFKEPTINSEEKKEQIPTPTL